MKEIKTIKKNEVKGKIFTAKEVAEYLSDTIDKYYCDDVINDVVIFNTKENDYWLLADDVLTEDDTVISSKFYTEDDVYFYEGELDTIINNCNLFDFTVINGEIYKIED